MTASARQQRVDAAVYLFGGISRADCGATLPMRYRMARLNDGLLQRFQLLVI